MEPTATPTFNTSALTKRITPAERKRLGYSGLPVWVGIVVAALGATGFVLAAVTQHELLLGMIIVDIGLFVVGLILLASAVSGRAQARLHLFCADNGLRYRATIPNPPYASLLFSRGHSRRIENNIQMLDSDGQPALEFGGFEYTTGHGRSRQTHNWKFIRIALDRNLPHMLLDAHSNNLKLLGMNFSNLNEGFSKDQVIHLEGNFSDHFTLYGPPEYQVDARYVFTPDLMHLLIENTAKYDAEIIDNYIYFYQSGIMPMAGKGFIKHIEDVIGLYNAIALKLQRQTRHYADERVGDRAANQVHESGRRLKRRVPVTTVIFLVVFVLWWIWIFIAQ